MKNGSKPRLKNLDKTMLPHQKQIMKYKIVVKTGDKIFVKDVSKSKDNLLIKAESLSKKHPKWKVYVVAENTIIY